MVQIYHRRHQSAPTAETLMRSKYSAHVIIDSQYIIDSNHFSTRGNQTKIEIEAWAKNCTWQKLEIISTFKGLENDLEDEVEFKAYYINITHKPQTHHEKSTFKKMNDQWFFVNGKVISAKINDNLSTHRNAPCLRGYGKKFKNVAGSDFTNFEYNYIDSLFLSKVK